MKEKIQQYLQEIENQKSIKILLACETGSRAWGFPSPDSDYDIRLIYMHEKDWYLSLNEKKDTIELMLEDNNLDISGWDLRKSLRLLWKSNSALLERIQSPIIYSYDASFLEGINQLSEQCYSKIATMHHYLSMSKKMYSEIDIEGDFKLKKLFYALRTATACKWIVEKNSPPPIQFGIMLKELDIPEKIKARVNELIVLKSHQIEAYLHKGEKEILDFIDATIVASDKLAKSLPASRATMNDLNDFFIKSLNVYDHK